MNVILETMGSVIYAMNPQIEKVQGQNRLRLVQSGCSHILLISTPLGSPIDLEQEDIRKILTNLEEKVFKGETEVVFEKQLEIESYSHVDLQDHGGKIPLPEKTAEYAILGVTYDKRKGEAHIFLPNNSAIKYKTTATIEVAYKLSPYTIPQKRGIFGLGREEEQQTGFYKLVIGNEKTVIPTGCLVYTIGKQPYEYPITDKVCGKEVLIKANGIPPVLKTTISGITLRKL